MSYTVRELAKLSGVTVRTLHWYDQIGLLKPAYYGNNGYRYYEKQQILYLQQILFFKELGFQLEDIQKLLVGTNFDKISALRAHRKKLEKRLDQAKQLIKNVDKTISYLEGKLNMKDEEFYYGFDSTKEEAYENELRRLLKKKKNKSDKAPDKTQKTWEKIDSDDDDLHDAVLKQSKMG